MPEPDFHPNLLVLLSDQLRRQALSIYGDPDARTPHTTQLAADGVRFDCASSTYPICVPFRFTLMTGHYAHSRLIPGIEWRMAPTERTLADEFNEAGYETIYIGKWHLDGGHGRLGSAEQVNRQRVQRQNQGRWEKWMGFELRNDPFDTWYFEDDDPAPRPLAGYQTDGLCDLGMDYLRQRRARGEERPFCMVVSVEPPHNPFVAPPDLQSAWEARDIALPPNLQADDPEQRDRLMLDRQRYNAMVEDLDLNVGRLRAFLDSQDLSRNTVIVFMADHGELGGAHGLSGKQWPYEESVGIPLVVCDPRCPSRAGTCLADPVATEDFYPTLLGLCGLPSRDDLHGQDLTPLLRGDTARLAREGVLLEFVAELRRGMPFYEGGWRAFRTRHHKYTVRGDNMGARPWQFFDLSSDPWEQSNRLDDPACSGEVARLHHLLCDRLVETDDHFCVLPAHGCDGVNDWSGLRP